jgi:Tol biopolymer transport system component
MGTVGARCGLAALAGVAIAALAAPSAQAEITNACVNTADKPAEGDCHRASFSANSRFMAFDSDAANLAPRDHNDRSDVFVRDRLRGKTELISTKRKGRATPDGVSFGAKISADGRFVTFVSVAPGLVRGVEGRSRQVYVYDRKTNETRLVSVATDGGPAGGDSDQPAISGDGSVVVFHSYGKDLVADDTNRADDIFARNLTTGVTVRVNVNEAGVEDSEFGGVSPSISDDGNLVAFQTGVYSILPENHYGEVYVKHLDTGALDLASRGLDGGPGDEFDEDASISPDGRFVAFSSTSSNLAPGAVGGERDVYVRDLLTQTTTRVSVDAAGVALEAGDYNPSISAGGTKVAFISSTLKFDDIRVRDLTAATTTLATPHTPDRGDGCVRRLHFICGQTSTPVLSPDGSLLAFEAVGTGYVPGDGRYIDLLVSE